MRDKLAEVIREDMKDLDKIEEIKEDILDEMFYEEQIERNREMLEYVYSMEDTNSDYLENKWYDTKR